MLVSKRPDGCTLQLVPQVNHAHVSGEVARAWQKPAWFNPSAWEEFIQAVRHHDDGWQEVDANPPIDREGHPVHFTAYSSLPHIDIWHRSLTLAQDRLTPLAQLFIATHLRQLLQKRQTALPDSHADSASQSFANTLQETIEGLLAQLSPQRLYRDALSADHFQQSIDLFAFFDALSLVFGKGMDWISFTHLLPVGQEVQKMKIHTEICAIRWGRMTPWPFVEEDVSFHLTYYRIPDKAYDSPQSLAVAMAQAKPITQPFNLGRL